MSKTARRAEALAREDKPRPGDAGGPAEMPVEAQRAEAEEETGKEETGKDACPAFTIRADSPFGMRVMVHLTHWAHGDHLASPELKAAFQEKMREFELWREAHK
jgi:hypothetical protein